MLRVLNAEEMGMVSGGNQQESTTTTGDNQDGMSLNEATVVAAAYIAANGDASAHEPDMGQPVETNVDTDEVEAMEQAMEIILRNTPGIGHFEEVEYDEYLNKFYIIQQNMV